MKILFEFSSWEEVVEFVEKVLGDSEPEAGKEKKTRTRKTKEEASPNAPTSSALPATQTTSPTATTTDNSNPLAGLTGGGGSDLDSMLGLSGTTAAPAKQYTKEEVREKAGNIAQGAPKAVTDAIVNMIRGYGVKDISQMSDPQLNDIYTKLDTIKK